MIWFDDNDNKVNTTVLFEIRDKGNPLYIVIGFFHFISKKQGLKSFKPNWRKEYYVWRTYLVYINTLFYVKRM